MRFGSNNKIIEETNTSFEGLDKWYYTNCIKMLKHRWNKCIKLKGDYAENLKNI